MTIEAAPRPHAPVGRAADEDLYASLVGALYEGRKSLVGASITAVLICGAAFLDRGDRAYLDFGLAFLVVSALRIAGNVAYARVARAGRPPNLPAWERGALAGAWAFAAMTGCLAAYSTIVHTGDDAELLTSCCAFGYIAGLSSRNASRPLIAVGQISAISVPLLVGLLARPDLTRLALAAFVAALFASTVLMARRVHATIVARYRANAELERAALYDPLTGLKNRAPFIGLVNGMCAGLMPGAPLTLMAVDLDRFKAVNDRLGHPAGDRVLVEAARRIQAAVGVPHEAARVGGDEFLVAIPRLGAEAAARVAERIRAALAREYAVDGVVVSCGASLGVAVGPEFGRGYDALMRGADLALYAAKHAGRGRAEFYSAALGETFDARAELEEALRGAIGRDELALAYQPIVHAPSGRIVGCEALLRWNRGGRVAVSPGEFIPIAEATGLIVDLGRWALGSACRQAASWPSEMRVSVNLSPLQVATGDLFLADVRAALRSSGLPAHRLELEVTESLLIRDTEGAALVIDALRAMGVRVALDDFGAGYSSLAYLRDFGFTKVKIDRKLCSDLCADNGAADDPAGRDPGRREDLASRSRSIVRCVTGLAGELGLEVVAEGIERLEDLRTVRDLGVTLVQGFIYARPLSASHIGDFIASPVLLPRPPRSARPTAGDVKPDAELPLSAVGSA